MEIHGRLGNQMFQYATLRAYMEKHNKNELALNFKNGVYNRQFENNLLDFNIINYKEVDTLAMDKKQKILIYMMTNIEKVINKTAKSKSYSKNKLEKRFQNVLMKNGIYYLHQGYMNFLPTKKENQIFIGNFESPKYFNEIKETILKEFTPVHDKLEKNVSLYKKIETTESVCISIRRGDFLTEKNKKAHYVCTERYFSRAIEKINEKVKNPRFFIFSDDIKWVKENMQFPEGTEFETGDDPVWEKLRLMYECKHFIISNSTFSWWAQYLSRNENKVVIAPTIWKNSYQNDDIYEDSWTLVEP